MTNRDYLISVLATGMQHSDYQRVCYMCIPCPYNLCDPEAYCQDEQGFQVIDINLENCAICKDRWLNKERENGCNGQRL